MRRRRITRGISQLELAQRLGVAPQRLSDYETGRRRWPPELWTKACAELELTAKLVVPFEVKDYRRYGTRIPWGCKVDPGQTWATIEPGYRNIYQEIDPKRVPDFAFRDLIRCDSKLEPLAWTMLCEAGFEPNLVSPILMGFEHFALQEHRGQALGLAPKAALLLKQSDCTVFLWPQLWMQTPVGRICPDALILVMGSTCRRWYLMEIDGSAHSNPIWDRERDEKLGLPVLRFHSMDVLGMNLAEKLLGQLRTETVAKG